MTPQQIAGLIMIGLGALVVMAEVIFTNIYGRNEGCLPYVVGGALIIGGGSVISWGHV